MAKSIAGGFFVPSTSAALKAAGGALKKTKKSKKVKKPRNLNKKGAPYPKIHVDGFGDVPFPKKPFKPNNSSALRSKFTASHKKEFKKWWKDQGRPWPRGKVEIHHIKPLKHGGTNDFSNLVPLKPAQHKPFTKWWSSV